MIAVDGPIEKTCQSAGDVRQDAVGLRLGDREDRTELANREVGSQADATDEHALSQRSGPRPAAARLRTPELSRHGGDH
jgi:hypothetical protein